MISKAHSKEMTYSHRFIRICFIIGCILLFTLPLAFHYIDNRHGASFQQPVWSATCESCEE